MSLALKCSMNFLKSHYLPCFSRTLCFTSCYVSQACCNGIFLPCFTLQTPDIPLGRENQSYQTFYNQCLTFRECILNSLMNKNRTLLWKGAINAQGGSVVLWLRPQAGRSDCHGINAGSEISQMSDPRQITKWLSVIQSTLKNDNSDNNILMP